MCESSDAHCFFSFHKTKKPCLIVIDRAKILFEDSPFGKRDHQLFSDVDYIVWLYAMRYLRKVKIIPWTECQSARSASTIFIREALKAGSAPPVNPMIRANAMDSAMMRPFRVKAKASSAKV